MTRRRSPRRRLTVTEFLDRYPAVCTNPSLHVIPTEDGLCNISWVIESDGDEEVHFHFDLVDDREEETDV